MSGPLPPWLKEVPGGVELQLHVQPRASGTRAVGTHGDGLKLQVAAPRALRVWRDQVNLGASATGRRKRVCVLGVNAGQASQALKGSGG